MTVCAGLGTALPQIPETRSHDLYRQRQLHRLQIHRLRRSLPEDPAGLTDEGTAPIAETEQAPDTEAEAAVEGDTVPEMSETEVTPGVAADEAVDEDRTEVFFTFTWGGNRGGQRKQSGGRPQGKPKGKPRGKGGPKGGNKPQNFEARPPRKEKAIDPDNPFAQALAGLAGKKD